MDRDLSLRQIYTSVLDRSDKGTTHSYMDMYELLLHPYRHLACAVLEVGVWRGGSIEMWSRYFSAARIVGVDSGYDRRWGVAPLPSILPERVEVIVGDSTSPPSDAVRSAAPYDVIIDDGSHLLSDQIATFRHLSPLLRSGGIYIIEDVGSVIEDLARASGVIENVPVKKAIETLSELAEGMCSIDLRATKGKYNDVLMVWRRP